MKHDATTFGPADMGDILSHVAYEDEAVDPDLDLDCDSIAAQTLSQRSSQDSTSHLDGEAELQ